jgi:nicotinamidase-related amidase/catechol 2,3-dioxygenase-like lactoylglutathione lyase family enzyme
VRPIGSGQQAARPPACPDAVFTSLPLCIVSGMRLNHLTLEVSDVEASAAFYARLGLTQIVASYPDYARFVASVGDTTLSLHRSGELLPQRTASIHFEVADVDRVVGELEQAGFRFQEHPVDQPYLWREAVLLDPDGHRVFVYHAGENRLDPPWRLGRDGSPLPVADPYTDPDFAAAALITIDTQCDVLDGGPLEIRGTSAALGGMRTLVQEFRAAGRPIVHVVRLYESDGANVDLCRRRAVESGLQILAPDAPGSQIAAELLPQPHLTLDEQLLLAGGVQHLGPGEVALYKPRWGAFYGTSLEQHLREQQVDTLVFCGCNFPNCPRTSIYQASERDFRVVLAGDAISGLYERGGRELANIGVRLQSVAEIVAALAAASGATDGAL